MSDKPSEETFEFIETPAASSTVSEFDCGVKTTSVRSLNILGASSASHWALRERAIELTFGVNSTPQSPMLLSLLRAPAATHSTTTPSSVC
jgi:hypothetical protein